ncbi:hypothetical protein BU16DRAFT_28879 [Lophium mytilinum]|uniref:Uncharacterized protein n=1 Tax=Lophium mytilinum TaxID=390894 RepID=A0A6A6RF49_9PEZI|nr:hypothetical protein BU16DRAFT_28879 [Lophium mytilinum]
MLRISQTGHSGTKTPPLHRLRLNEACNLRHNAQACFLETVSVSGQGIFITLWKYYHLNVGSLADIETSSPEIAANTMLSPLPSRMPGGLLNRRIGYISYSTTAFRAFHSSSLEAESKKDHYP